MSVKTYENFLPSNYKELTSSQKYDILKPLCEREFKVKITKPSREMVVKKPGARWDDLEEKYLIYNVINGTLEQLTELHNRNAGALLTRIQEILTKQLFEETDVELDGETQIKNHNMGTCWTVKEENDLIVELGANLPLKQISELHGRSENAIMLRMGLMFEKMMRPKT